MVSELNSRVRSLPRSIVDLQSPSPLGCISSTISSRHRHSFPAASLVDLSRPTRLTSSSISAAQTISSPAARRSSVDRLSASFLLVDLPQAISSRASISVYLSLCCALIASAAGAYLHILWNIGGLLTTLGCLGGIVWLLLTPPYEEKKRVSLLMAAALFEGASIGPLIKMAIEIDPSILVSAFVGCAVALGCFSMAAMLARHREYLYLGGLLSSGLGILFWLHFASCVFGETAALFKLESYFGHLVFVGYIVVDTQDIIEKAQFGDLDYVKHALTLFTDFVVKHAMTLFTDFVAVFVRILIIMLKN